MEDRFIEVSAIEKFLQLKKILVLSNAEKGLV